MKFFNFIILFLVFVSCEKEIELEPVYLEPKLVVNCLFTPDSAFRVYVSNSQMINENANHYINDAEVLLFKDDVLIDSLDYLSNGCYISTYFPEYNSCYKIEVRHQAKFVSAKSCVPKIFNAWADYRVENDNPNGSNPTVEWLYRIFLNDDIESLNYYQTMEGLIFQIASDYDAIRDPSVLSDSNLPYNPRSIFFTDNLFNGDSTTIIELNVIQETTIFHDPFTGEPILTDIPNRTKSLSFEYYSYIKSWTKHRFNQNSTTNINDPLTIIFQGEPSEMYTNIEGGYGIFAGYCSKETQLIFIP